jgi:hypothetical protein
VTAAEKRRIEETRREARGVLEHLEHTSRLARIAIDGEEPEHAAEYILDTLSDLRPRLPALRRALMASRDIQ